MESGVAVNPRPAAAWLNAVVAGGALVERERHAFAAGERASSDEV